MNALFVYFSAQSCCSRCAFGLLIFYRFVFSVFHLLAFGALAAKRGFDEIARLSIAWSRCGRATVATALCEVF